MRYAAATQTYPGFVAPLNAAQSEAVIIERDERESAVCLRGEANADFQEICDAISDKAVANGLTETTLVELLKV